VKEGTEVHYVPSGGYLYLAFRKDEFARIRDLLIAEAEVAQFVNEQPELVYSIEITVIPEKKPSFRMRDRIALLGCGLIGCIAIFVWIVGVTTIMRWSL
jgi:hypothetical protein